MKRIFKIIILITSIMFLNSCKNIIIGSTKGDGWTFMIYIAGDNSLSDDVEHDINEMEQGLYDSENYSLNNDIKIMVLKDQEESNDTELYLIQPDNDDTVIASKRIIDDDYPASLELDMSKSETLANFVTYSMNKCPSEHYALIIWNHGAGARSSMVSSTSREFCEDEDTDGIMYTNQLQEALYEILEENESNPPLDILGFDACLMGTVESAYEYRKIASYYVGSLANEWKKGWDYTEIFKNFNEGGNPPSVSEMSDILVEQFYLSTKNYSNEPHTLVSVKTSELTNLKTKIDKLASLLYDEANENYKSEFEKLRKASIFAPVDSSNTNNLIGAPYYDLYDLCENIKGSSVFDSVIVTTANEVNTALANAVVACYAKSDDLNLDYFYTDDLKAVRGLSILVPNGEREFVYNSTQKYSFYDFCYWYTSKAIETEGGIDFCSFDDDNIVESWRELFEAWYIEEEPEY